MKIIRKRTINKRRRVFDAAKHLYANYADRHFTFRNIGAISGVDKSHVYALLGKRGDIIQEIVSDALASPFSDLDNMRVIMRDALDNRRTVVQPALLQAVVDEYVNQLTSPETELRIRRKPRRPGPFDHARYHFEFQEESK